MSNHYVNYQSNQKTGIFEKGTIAASQSAFANDVTHIKSFGVSKGSNFETVELYPQYAFHTSAHDYPVLMKADGYTRSFGQLIVPKKRPVTPKMDISSFEAPERTIIGHKQATGSIKNNQAYQEIREGDPTSRFTSETSQK